MGSFRQRIKPIKSIQAINPPAHASSLAPLGVTKVWRLVIVPLRLVKAARKETRRPNPFVSVASLLTSNIGDADFTSGM